MPLFRVTTHHHDTTVRYKDIEASSSGEAQYLVEGMDDWSSFPEVPGSGHSDTYVDFVEELDDAEDS